MDKKKIIEKEEFNVVGYGIDTDLKSCQLELPRLWDKFMDAIDNIKNKISETITYGVCIAKEEADPNNQDFIFNYVAGVEVSNTVDIPEGMVHKKISKGRFAVFEHKGNINDLNQTYDRIMKEDIPNNNIQPNGIWIERYDERFIPESDESIMEILVGIKEPD